MLQTLFPKAHRRYESSCCARELEAFAGWLMASGYSRENTCDHLYRLRCVLEVADESAADTRFSTGQLAALFTEQDAPGWRVALYQATRRVYQRFLVAQHRLDDETTPQILGAHGPDEYGCSCARCVASHR